MLKVLLTACLTLSAIAAQAEDGTTVVTTTPRTVTYSTTTSTYTSLPNGGFHSRKTFEERANSSTQTVTTSSKSTFTRGRGRLNCNANGCFRRTGAYVVAPSNSSYRDTFSGTLRPNNLTSNPGVSTVRLQPVTLQVFNR
ncbi:MAG: hypothetical protein GC134_09715 [Proteobacteria bacterium]|nr:hypothetical protein [Pseudomonadota bacterium]